MIKTSVLACAGCVFVTVILDASIVWSQTATAPKEGTTKSTYTYKSVGSCAIKADVYREVGATRCRHLLFTHAGQQLIPTVEYVSEHCEQLLLIIHRHAIIPPASATP